MELISREEALSILNDTCNHALNVYDKKYHLPIRTITSKAIGDIKRLPSQWVEINEPPFGKVYQNSFVTFLSTETYDEVRRRLCRPKGKWNHYTDDRNDYVECSECHYGDEGEVKLGYPQKMGWRFCPHCGADMRGEQ